MKNIHVHLKVDYSTVFLMSTKVSFLLQRELILGRQTRSNINVIRIQTVLCGRKGIVLRPIFKYKERTHLSCNLRPDLCCWWPMIKNWALLLGLMVIGLNLSQQMRVLLPSVMAYLNQQGANMPCPNEKSSHTKTKQGRAWSTKSRNC